jgi:flagellar biosynthesis/type III secretory pathway chaperone
MADQTQLNSISDKKRLFSADIKNMIENDDILELLPLVDTLAQVLLECKYPFDMTKLLPHYAEACNLLRSIIHQIRKLQDPSHVVPDEFLNFRKFKISNELLGDICAQTVGLIEVLNNADNDDFQIKTSAGMIENHALTLFRSAMGTIYNHTAKVEFRWPKITKNITYFTIGADGFTIYGYTAIFKLISQIVLHLWSAGGPTDLINLLGLVVVLLCDSRLFLIPKFPWKDEDSGPSCTTTAKELIRNLSRFRGGL